MAREPRFLLACLALLACLGLRGPAQGDGGLDLGFGRGGVVTEELTDPEAFHLSHVLVQPDGKAVVAGWAWRDERRLVARLLLDGSLDPAFGVGGLSAIPANGYIENVTLLSDGHVVVAGGTSSLLRLRPDGSVASMISRSGRVAVLAIADQGEGALLTLELSDWTTMAPLAVRYDAHAVDRTFASGGVLRLPDGTVDLLGLADGSFLISIADPDGSRVRRLRRDGSPDAAFAGTGAVLLPESRYPRLAAAAGGFLLLTSLGGRLDIRRYDALGSPEPAFVFEELVPPDRWDGPWNISSRLGGGFLLWRDTRPLLALTEAGTRDARFAEGGELRLPEALELRGLAPTADGGVLASGPLPRGCGLGSVLRFQANGGPDPRFGRGGALYPPLSRPLPAFQLSMAMAPQASGRILAAAGTPGAVVLERLLHDGSPDAGFGIGGRLELIRSDDPTRPSCLGGGFNPLIVASRPDGKAYVVFGGTIGRLMPDGTWDPAFGGTGWVVMPPALLFSKRVLLLRGGGLLVAGSGEGSAVLVRLDDEGRLDRTFGVEGVVEKRFVYSSDVVRGYGNAIESLFERVDGRVVIAGSCFAAAPASFLAARFLPNGALDPAFGSGAGWIQTKRTGMWSATGRCAVELPDGRVLVAGESSAFYPNIGSLTLARLMEDGRLDETFGSSGYVLSRLDRPDSTRILVTAMVRQPDARLLVAGWFESSDDGSGVLSTAFLARFHPDGALDRSFGTRGVLELRSPAPFVGSEIVELAITGASELLVGGRQVRQGDQGRAMSLLLARFAATTPVELVRFVAE